MLYPPKDQTLQAAVSLLNVDSGVQEHETSAIHRLLQQGGTQGRAWLSLGNGTGTPVGGTERRKLPHSDLGANVLAISATKNKAASYSKS